MGESIATNALASAALEEQRALMLVNKTPNASKWMKIKLDIPQPTVAAVAPVAVADAAEDAADAPQDANANDANVAAPAVVAPAIAPVPAIAPARSGQKKKAFILVSKDNCDAKFWPEMVLRAVKEFLQFHSMHNLTPEAMYTYFRETLDGAAKDQWDVEMEGADISVDGFNETLEKWISYYVEDSQKPDQIQYMKAYRNNGRMPVDECVSRLATLNGLLKYWGSDDGHTTVPFDTAAFLVLVFETTMTTAWRIEFQAKGHKLSEMTLKSLMKFMKIEEAKDKAKKVLEDTPIARKSRKTREGSQKMEKKVKKQRIGYSGNGNCRYHPGQHDWKDCFGNKNGNNYKESYVLPPLPENRNKQNGKKQWNKKKTPSTSEDVNFMDVDVPAGDTKQQVVRFLSKCDPEFHKLDDKAKAIVRKWLTPPTTKDNATKTPDNEEHYFDALSKSEDINSGLDILDISED